MTTAMHTVLLYVIGAITLTPHMVAPPTAITDRSGSTAASLLARDRGTAGAAADTDTVTAGKVTSHAGRASGGRAAVGGTGLRAVALVPTVAALVPTVAADTAAAGLAVPVAAAMSAADTAAVVVAVTWVAAAAMAAAADTGKSVGL